MLIHVFLLEKFTKWLDAQLLGASDLSVLAQFGVEIEMQAEFLRLKLMAEDLIVQNRHGDIQIFRGDNTAGHENRTSDSACLQVRTAGDETPVRGNDHQW